MKLPLALLENLKNKKLQILKYWYEEKLFALIFLPATTDSAGLPLSTTSYTKKACLGSYYVAALLDAGGYMALLPLIVCFLDFMIRLHNVASFQYHLRDGCIYWCAEHSVFINSYSQGLESTFLFKFCQWYYRFLDTGYPQPAGEIAVGFMCLYSAYSSFCKVLGCTQFQCYVNKLLLYSSSWVYEQQNTGIVCSNPSLNYCFYKNILLN